eukprot:g21887.t1
MIAFSGYDGFLYSIGYLAGWIVALFVIAEPLKRMGKFTFADALDSKFNSRAIKLTAAVSTLAVSIFYLIPQMVGAGVLIQPLFGLPHYAGVLMVGIVVIVIVVTAGMVSTTYVQFLKGSLLVVFSAVLTMMILNRGLEVDSSQTENLRPLEFSPEEFSEPAPGEKLVEPTGEWKSKGYIRFKRVAEAKGKQLGEVITWVQVKTQDGVTGFLPCQTKTVTADGDVLVNGLPQGRGEGKTDLEPVGFVRKLPPGDSPEADDGEGEKKSPQPKASEKTKSGADGGSTLPAPGGSTLPPPGGSTLPPPGGSTLPPPGGSTLPAPGGSTLPAPGGSGLPAPGGDNELAAPGAGEAEVKPPRMKTGPLGPMEFLATLQDSEVILWGKDIVRGDDGSVTTVYFPKPTPGSEILRPGNHPRFKGIRSEEPVDKLNFLSLMLALFCGTAALPHILIRYYTVKDQASARKSTIVGIGAIGFFYVLTLYLGLGAMTSGAMDVTNSNMAAPLLAKSMKTWLFAVISAIAFTTVLGTVSGLIIASSGAVVHDLMGSVFKIEMTDHSKVRVAKLASIVVGGIAIVLGILFENMNVSYLVGWAFSVAASANLPALVMLLFWKGTTKQGIAAAIFVGMVSSLGWILLSGDTYSQVYGLNASDSIIPFSQPGIVTIPLGFLTLIVVSLLTRKSEAAGVGIMPEREFELYLSLLSKMLRLSPEQRAAITAEMRDHLEERFTELTGQGRSRDDAIRIALDEFGDAAAMATDFTHISKRKTRRTLMRFTVGSVAVTSIALFVATAFWPTAPHAPAPARANAQTRKTPAKGAEKNVASTHLAGGVVAPSVSELERKLGVKLKNEMWEDVMLRDLFAKIGKQIGADIVVDKQYFDDAGIDLETKVSLKFEASEITARTALELILEFAGATDTAITNRGGLIYLTHSDRDYVTVVYNCRDLFDDAAATYAAALKRQRFGHGSGQGFFSVFAAQLDRGAGLAPKAQRDAGSAPHARAGIQQQRNSKPNTPPDPEQSIAKSFINVVQSTVRTTNWREIDGEGATISVFNGLVVVSANHAAHLEIKELINMLRTAAAQPVARKKPAR